MARILVAEDDPKQAELIRRYAVAEGHAVTVVHDGSAALDAVRTGRGTESAGMVGAPASMRQSV